MAYQDPSNRRRPDDYIDQTGDMGWKPILLALVLVAVFAFLIFGSPRSADHPSATAQRGELPNTAPSAPSVPGPSPPEPQ
jgi:hypothetical protein